MGSEAVENTQTRRFEQLFDDHARDVLAYLVRRTVPPSDAADLLAEVFVVAWRRVDELPPDPDARLWLFGVARRTLSTHRRGQRRRSALADRLRRELGAEVAGNDGEQPVDPAVGRALARLRPADRELLQLTAWDGLTPSEAATVLGIEPGAARVRLHRARARFISQFDTDRNRRLVEEGGRTHPHGNLEDGIRPIAERRVT